MLAPSQFVSQGWQIASAAVVGATVLAMFLATLTSPGLEDDNKNEDVDAENARLCVTCRVQQRKGTYHCSICNVCVRDWHHHCAFMVRSHCCLMTPTQMLIDAAAGQMCGTQ